MAKIFGKTKETVNVTEDLKSKVKKIEFNEILNEDLIRKNLNRLTGRETGGTRNIEQLIQERFEANNADLYAEMEKKVNELIPEEMVKCIKETVTAQEEKLKIEKEINNLKQKRSSIGNRETIDSQMQIMQLSIEIDAKEDELRESLKTFINSYKAALGTTQISVELSNMFNQVRNIENEMITQLNEEIELTQAKVSVLKKAFNHVTLVNDYRDLIENRMEMSGGSAEAIRSSEMGMPYIGAFIK